jgi:hypothetical protein
VKSNYKTRLLALATVAVGRRAKLPAPLLVLHSTVLPSTPQPVIDAALAAGRPVFHVHFVKAPDGGLGAMVDNVPDEIKWNRPEDAPMVDVYALESGELKVVDRRPLERP